METDKNRPNKNSGNKPKMFGGFPAFNPDEAKKLRGEAFFTINPKDYPIFSKQGGMRINEETGKMEQTTLDINETLGLMVGRAAETITAITGEDGNHATANHVIYLDKSARPVSWMVDEFWDEATNMKKPDQSFLAIDRRVWFPRAGVNLSANEYITEPDGSSRPAGPMDFDISKVSKEDLARIRALYIEGGIDDDSTTEENFNKIFKMPTVLDDKNLLIVDEVSRSGSTVEIAKKLLKAAVPKLANVDSHVFWSDATTKTDQGDTQMGFAPVWYPHAHSDWRGRGVKDINPVYFENKYKLEPTKENLARKFGAFVLGEPLDNPEDEPEQLSKHLFEEIQQMHKDYKAGKILPNFPALSNPSEKMISQLEEWGVKFVPRDEAGNDPHAYCNMIDKRDGLTTKKKKK